MENMVNLYDIALYCRNDFREKHNSDEDKYIHTLFVGITKENVVKVSTTPHILSGCQKCILIHQYICFACTNYYSWYMVEFIDSDGVVRKEALDDEYKLSISAHGSYKNQVMSLERDNTELYCCQGDWGKCIKTVWNLYMKCKECSSLSEAILLAKLTKKDDTILKLQKANDDLLYSSHLLKYERDMYKGLLDEIKLLVKK